MNSCFPPLSALSLGDNNKSSGAANGGTAIDGSANLKNKKKSYWGSNSSLRKLSVASAVKERKSSSNCNGGAVNLNATTNGKIEVLQDLDLYYIKQIAHNLKEFDLERKIDLEIKMREGSTKLLAASKHQSQSLEAAKNLLISNERMNAYMSELQNRKRDTSSRTIGGYSAARLSLSDLRMPLMWRDIDHFKNKGDYRRYALFCLAKVGPEMYDTCLLYPVDRSLTDLTFPDVLIFNKVNPDFSLKLEVYGHMLQDDFSMASAPRRIKNTIHTSISRTVGKKLAATLRDELNSGKIGPNFELMATAHLSLDDIHDSIRTHDLKIESTDIARNQLPLFGNFCCRLAAQPNCMLQETYSGHVTYLRRDKRLKKNENESQCWIRCWAQLKAFKLNLWLRYDYCLEEREPLATIEITRGSVIMAKGNSSFEIEISNEQSGQNQCSLIKTDSLEERGKWFRYLTQHVTDNLRWKRAAEKLMEIQAIEPNRHSFVKSTTRYGSLYDQTPLAECNTPLNGYRASSTASQLTDDLTVSSSVASASSAISCSSSRSCSPFRERSLSSSTSVSIRPKRSYWSFSKSNHR